MTSICSGVFSQEDIVFMTQHPNTLDAKDRLSESSHTKHFTIPLTENLRNALSCKIGLDLANVSDLPMRWIQGDTVPHVDQGSISFENTYLVYLKDSEGEFVLDDVDYPIEANTGFVFSEGVSHKTQNTGTEPRLLVGPMNEYGLCVGQINVNNGNDITYFANQSDASNNINSIGASSQYTVGSGVISDYPSNTRWRIDPTNSVGTSDMNIAYNPGDVLSSDDGLYDNYLAIYFLYPIIISYYPSETDALNNTNVLGDSGDSTTIGNGYIPGLSNHWVVASNSYPNIEIGGGYYNGDVINIPVTSHPVLFLFPYQGCFLEGTNILTLVNEKETYLPIETLRKGNLIKTSKSGYQKIELIAKGNVYNPGNNERTKDRLYKYSPMTYPELTEDLYMTGQHAILVDEFTELQRENTIRCLGKKGNYIIEGKCRLMSHLNELAEPWNSEGNFTIWHLALENENENGDYGIYANGGLLVESCPISNLKKNKNMTMVE
jgi:hypothetical protein